MPWHVEQNHDGCPDSKPYAVIKDSDGSVAGCHETREQADDQVAALYANEDEMSANVAHKSQEQIDGQAAAYAEILEAKDDPFVAEFIELASRPMTEEQIAAAASAVGTFIVNMSPEKLAEFKAYLEAVRSGDEPAPLIEMPDETHNKTEDYREFAELWAKVAGSPPETWQLQLATTADTTEVFIPEGSTNEFKLFRETFENVAQLSPRTWVTAAAVDFSEGSMVAVFPTPDEAAGLAEKDGQEVNKLHVTLAFLPEGVEDVEALSARLREAASALPSLSGSVGGVGHFAAGDDGVPVLALPDVDGLAELRQVVVDALDELGVVRARNHGWTPHLTLSYQGEGDVALDSSAIGKPLTFGALSLVVGEERYDFPLEADMNGDNPEDFQVTTLETPENGSRPSANAGFTVTGATVTQSSEAGSSGEFYIRFTPTMTAAADPEDEDEMEDMGPAGWEGILALEGYATNDRRYLMPGEISERELPLPLMFQKINAEGHKGAEVAGNITEVWRVPNKEYGENAVEVWGRGMFDDSPTGREATRLVEADMLRGFSVDMDPSEVVLLDAETLEPINPEEMEFEDMIFSSPIEGYKGKIMGVTLLPFPAIEHASITVIGGEEKKVLVASAFGMRVVRAEVLTASALGQAPLKPPLEWFETPEASEPTPLTVTKDGRVFGHLAAWNECHVGWTGVCKTPPRSASEYRSFHLGQLETAEGELISIGKITVDAPHAPAIAGLSHASVRDHYDQSGTVAAFVRAHDGRHGIWLSGAIRSDVPAEKIRDLRANPPSGDWRGHELQAVLCVPVPGFPIPRAEVALVASGAEEEIAVLIATGYVHQPTGEKERLRKIRTLTKRARAAAA